MAIPLELTLLLQESFTTFVPEHTLEAVACQKPNPTENDSPSGYYCGVVHILGSWYGTISLEAPRPFIDQLVYEMKLLSDDTKVEDAARDLIAELVNIVGGNVKSSLGERCILSPPKSYIEADATFSEPESTLEDERKEHVFGTEIRLCLFKPISPPVVEL